MIAAAKQPAAISAASPPTIAWPNARASRPATLERHVARAPTAAIAREDEPEDDGARRQERDLARVADRERVARGRRATRPARSTIRTPVAVIGIGPSVRPGRRQRRGRSPAPRGAGSRRMSVIGRSVAGRLR